ncbi:MAG: NAD(P)H-binding protein [Gammaproteobacteria bacterium]|nr:NAD(P)H-binding protein [Gammaproteobacteria bacterium]
MADDGIFILGSTGPTGTVLTGLLCGQGRPVVAMHRSDARQAEFEELGVQIVHGDAMDANSVAAAAREAAKRCHTVVNLIGGNPFADANALPDYTANRNVAEACEAAGLSRYLFVTSIGTGSSRPWVPDESFLFPVLDAKTEAEEHLKTTSLDWTILKPGGLGPPGSVSDSGCALVTRNPAVRGLIGREDLARTIIAVLDAPVELTLHQELHAVASRIELFEGQLDPLTLPDLPLPELEQ